MTGPLEEGRSLVEASAVLFTATLNTFYPKKCYTPFSTHPTPKIFASLFSTQATPSVHKLLSVYRYNSLSLVDDVCECVLD